MQERNIRRIGIYLGILLLLMVVCGLLCDRDRRNRPLRINAVSHLKQVGLAFRISRNDVAAPFWVDGPRTNGWEEGWRKR